MTDASPTGWGAHCLQHTVHGLWSNQELPLHINHLELLAIIKAFHAFLPLIRNQVVQLATDNTTALFYVNKQGGTHSPSLLYLVVTLWEWCYFHHVFPIAVHISMDNNTLADQLSRLPARTHKWSLNDVVFRQLRQWWGTPSIDLFATDANKKCPRFCSRAGQNSNSLGDEFLTDWSRDHLYIFSPLPLIQRVIVRI